MARCKPFRLRELRFAGLRGPSVRRGARTVDRCVFRTRIAPWLQGRSAASRAAAMTLPAISTPSSTCGACSESRRAVALLIVVHGTREGEASVYPLCRLLVHSALEQGDCTAAAHTSSSRTSKGDNWGQAPVPPRIRHHLQLHPSGRLQAGQGRSGELCGLNSSHQLTSQLRGPRFTSQRCTNQRGTTTALADAF